MQFKPDEKVQRTVIKSLQTPYEDFLLSSTETLVHIWNYIKIKLNYIKSMTYSSQGSHTGQLDFYN